MKAVLLAATFMIDYLFFEEDSNLANGAADAAAAARSPARSSST